ncbi:hypothetical protein AJ87_47570 [Rhizobium yanglingense]|nr:hypothetical protein AJ87_47570 [Rhizobium yanglingense]
MYDLNEERNRRLRRQSVETLRVLNEAGIEPLLIKGSALLMIMPEHRLGNRMISDLDLVIDRNNVERSVGRLRGIGYQPFQKTLVHTHTGNSIGLPMLVPWTCI